MSQACGPAVSPTCLTAGRLIQQAVGGGDSAQAGPRRNKPTAGGLPRPPRSGGAARDARTCWMAAKAGSEAMSRKTRSLRMSPMLSCGTGCGGTSARPSSGRKFTSVTLSLNTCAATSAACEVSVLECKALRPVHACTKQASAWPAALAGGGVVWHPVGTPTGLMLREWHGPPYIRSQDGCPSISPAHRQQLAALESGMRGQGLWSSTQQHFATSCMCV